MNLSTGRVGSVVLSHEMVRLCACTVAVLTLVGAGGTRTVNMHIMCTTHHHNIFNTPVTENDVLSESAIEPSQPAVLTETSHLNILIWSYLVTGFRISLLLVAITLVLEPLNQLMLSLEVVREAPKTNVQAKVSVFPSTLAPSSDNIIRSGGAGRIISIYKTGIYTYTQTCIPITVTRKLLTLVSEKDEGSKRLEVTVTRQVYSPLLSLVREPKSSAVSVCSDISCPPLSH